MKQGNTTEIVSLHKPMYVAYRGPERSETDNGMYN